MTGWLVDKSALVRLGFSSDAETWAGRIERGMISICSVTRLEVGYSARSGSGYAAIFGSPPVNSLLVEYFTPAIEDRALDVQRMLAERGQHRSASLADLLIAATAELARLTVLHLDKDFELIAEVTGQPVERLELSTGDGRDRAGEGLRG